MQHTDVARWRQQMGRGLADWTRPPGMLHHVEATAWLMLTGAPSPDVNLALVHDDDPEVLSSTLATIEQMSCPALLLLAGAGKSRAGDLPETWTDVGGMPMMMIELADSALVPDTRVRRAGAADLDVVTSLLTDAYGLEPDVADIPAAVLTNPSDSIAIWVLERDGEAVSTVTACRTDDVVSLWCMATPSRFERRGFGRALLAAVLQDSVTQGATTGLLAATQAGLPLYEAAGWQYVEDWQIFTNAVSVQFAH